MPTIGCMSCATTSKAVLPVAFCRSFGHGSVLAADTTPAIAERRILSQNTRLEANDLALFARIAEAGSFSRAAEQLGQPRSTVSRRLAELEIALGERLLIRSTRKLRLTEFGRSMLGHAAHVVEAVTAAAALADNRQAEPSGRLRVTMPPFIAQSVAAPMIERFLCDHPLVTLDLDLSSRRVDLLAEDYDLVVRVSALDLDASLTATLLAELPIALYAAPGYLQREGAPHAPQDLERMNALLIARHDGPQPWELVREDAAGGERWQGIARPRCMATSGEILLRLAVAGHGIVGLPEALVESQVRSGALVRVLPGWKLPDLPVWAAISGRQLLPTKTRAFLDALRAFFRH